ncbi:hypothetical protein DNI29_14845 [Hymenobacter sediminis]|uniref:hypothetical protein n=1 Tax=Hymenobacter sediminis TaxID=2218621 RepID=UPI000F4F75B4|nr:hypothetical protein [Hymenobacter sediminis]RPD46277.1 hypothetical protein DNI29_14845 [Hymenobacter sediminis]
MLVRKDKAFVDSRRVLNIRLYHMGLYTTTKLPIDTSFITDKYHYLSRVNNMFVIELNDAVSKAQKVDVSEFGYDMTRVCYVVKMANNKTKRIFIDRGGNHIMYNNLVYKVDLRIANIIIKYLLTDSSEVHGSLNKLFYNKGRMRGIYTPSILRYGS